MSEGRHEIAGNLTREELAILNSGVNRARGHLERDVSSVSVPRPWPALFYSHSMVAGGLLVMSKTTRFT
jgi:hypothetical protein